MRWKSALLCLVVTCVILPRALVTQAQTFGITLPRALNFATSPSPVGSGARAAAQGFAFIHDLEG